MEVVSGLDTTTSLLGVAWRLVNTILKAQGEVRNAKEKTNKLLDTVEKAKFSLRLLQNRPEGQPLWEGLNALLEVLGEELCLALEKVQNNVGSNERRETGNQLVATARSVIGRGASQQNKETLAIIQKLEEVLATLDRQVLYYIGGVAANNQALPRSLPLPHPEHELVARMLSFASRVDEILDLAVAVFLGNSWVDPSNSRKQAVKKPVGIRLNGRKRDAREGGYEIPNRAKVRFSMSVSFDQWYFYVLTSDRWANAEPRVVFPKSANNVTNWLSSKSKRPRIFPSKDLHPGDPISLKVERSAHLPDDKEGEVSIFLVVTTTPLQKDGEHGQITIQEIEQHMTSVGEDELIVKHIPFDILVAK